MAIKVERNGEWVELREFSNNEVIDYLETKLNSNNPRFEVVAKPKFCDGVMAKFNEVCFLIYANKTYIELSFEQTYAEKMAEVIEKLTQWDKFSDTEDTFYVEIDENNSRTIIFENGYATSDEYRKHFHNNKLKITTFKNS